MTNEGEHLQGNGVQIAEKVGEIGDYLHAEVPEPSDGPRT